MEATQFEARAIQKFLRRAPRKVRLIADAVRGENVEKALKRLSSLKKDQLLKWQKLSNQQQRT